MADFSQLIADVQAVIRENGRQLITGPVLQSTLIEIINTINADKQDPLNIVDALIAGSTDPVTSGAVEAAVSGLGIDLADEVNARIAADALLIPKADIVQTLGTATDKVPSVDLLRSQVALLQTAIGAKWTRPTVVSFDDAPSEEPIATYNGVDYYSQMDLFDAIVAQGRGGVAADTSVLAALGITPELITDANGAGSAGLIIEQKQLEMFWRSLFVKSENEWDGDDGDYYDFRDGEYWLSFHVDRPEGQPETITGHFSRDKELHRSDIEQTTGISTSKVMSQKAVTDALAGKQATISDLDAIRAGALLGSTAYQLPVGGIPYADLDTGVQQSLDKADTAMQPDAQYDGQLAIFDENGYVEGAGITPDELAQKDGTYPDLTAGAVLGAPVPAEFAYRGAPYGGSAVVDTVLGKSLVWNQLVPIPGNSKTGTWDAFTITDNRDGSYTLNGTITESGAIEICAVPMVDGHNYLVKCSNPAIADTNIYFGSGASVNPVRHYLSIADGTIYQSLRTRDETCYFEFSSGTFDNLKIWPKIIDLTAIFGSGNEPSTVSAFEAWVAQQGFAGLTDFNPGQVLGNAAKNIKTAGFQLWDEVWELGDINASNGQNVVDANHIRSRNPFEVFPGVSYFFKSPIDLFARFYDEDGNYLGYNYGGVNQITKNTARAIPAGARYMRFCGSATTYDHDICISISGPRNGQYEPYVGAIDTIALNLSTLTGIPEGGGSSEVVFPLGLQSIGGVSDWGKGSEAMRHFKVVDLGDLTWTYVPVSASYPYGYFYVDGLGTKYGNPRVPLVCSKYDNTADFYTDKHVFGATASDRIMVVDGSYTDPSTFKTAMEGVKLVYQLATPVKFTLDQPLPALYETAEGGPEYIEGPAGTAPTTAAFVGEIRYSQPQADANGLAVAILDALKAASKISSYTFGIDPETSKPAITIS